MYSRRAPAGSLQHGQPRLFLASQRSTSAKGRRLSPATAHGANRRSALAPTAGKEGTLGWKGARSLTWVAEAFLFVFFLNLFPAPRHNLPRRKQSSARAQGWSAAS